MVPDGNIDGDALKWHYQMKEPFPMKLKGEARLKGDFIEGTISAGAVGKSGLRATRWV